MTTLPDMPPHARACWEPEPAAVLSMAEHYILALLARQPFACGVLLGRTDVVGLA